MRSTSQSNWHRRTPPSTRIIGLVAVAVWSLVMLPNQVRSQQSLGIAAVVNDEMISILDINSHLTLAIALSRLPNTNETRRQLTPQALRNLIDDKIKMQEAKRLKIMVSQAEISDALSATERRNGIQPGQLQVMMKQMGIDKAIIMDQLESRVSWQKTINKKFHRSMKITDKDIDALIAETNKRIGQLEYLVSEIFLPVARPEYLQKVSKLANRLIQEIKGGANFAAVAKNFSQSPTAAVGGSLGWTKIEQLSSEIGETIKTMQPGQISNPLRTLDGVYIVKMAHKRKIEAIGTRKPPPPKINLFQLLFPLAIGADQSGLDQTARDLSKSAQSCQDMQALAARIKSPLSGNLGNLNISQLAPQIRKVVETLPISKASIPVKTDGGVMVFMVCDREQVVIVKEDDKSIRNRVRNKLISERFNLSARRHLRSLRRSAIIDTRI